MISTHALREEGDACNMQPESLAVNFYPRPPRGGRRLNMCSIVSHLLISTHALREEGDPNRVWEKDRIISISTHALREEGDTYVSYVTYTNA